MIVANGLGIAKTFQRSFLRIVGGGFAGRPGRSGGWLAGGWWMAMFAGAMTATCSAVWAVDVTPVKHEAPVPGLAPSFRVETDLFEGTQVKPQSQHLLLFDSGVIYDLPIGVGTTITVFDPIRNRVMLLHKTQRVRTSISTESLIQISAQVRSAAVEAGAENSLGLNARVVPGELEGTYVIEFGDTKYTATTQASGNEGIAAEYAAFTVWACRLNIARQVGSPPFARMTMAEFLASEKALPRQIRLDVKRGLKTRTYRAEHLYVGRLSDLDRKKISDVGQMIASFEEVEFSEFPAD
jgi:hypothetical protein